MSKFELGGVPSHAYDHFYTLRDKVCGEGGEKWSTALGALLAQADPVQAKEMLTSPRPRYPLYLMKADDEFQLLTLREAGVLYDNGFIRVDFGNFVLEDGPKIRLMTDDEKREISRIADEYSESK